MLTEKQLAQRQRGIGASEVAAVCGLNPWRKPIDVWLQKTGRSEPQPDSIASSAGHRLEGVLADWYAEERGLSESLAPSDTVVCANEPWLFATPDRLVMEAGKAIRVLEIKLVGARVAHHWLDDAMPDYVFLQSQIQQFVTGIHDGDVAALLGGTDFRILRSPYEPGVVADVVEVARSFWSDYVLKDVEPPIDASQSYSSYLAKKWQERGEITDAPLEAEEIAERLIQAKRRVAQAEEEQAVAENELKALIGERAGFRSMHGWRVTWKSRAGSTSWKKVAEEIAGDAIDLAPIAEKYRGESTRTFSFTASK